MIVCQTTEGKKVIVKGDHPGKEDDANDWGYWSSLE